MLLKKKAYHGYAWLIWLISACFYLYKYAIEVSPSVMVPDLMRTFQISGAGIGNLASAYFYAYFLMQFPVGVLSDHFGPRKTTTVAILICALGIYFFSRAGNLPEALLCRFVVGIGAAFAYVNALKLTGSWFATHRYAFMCGLLAAMGMVGAIGGEGVLASFVEHEGWRQSLRVIGYIGIVIAILFYLLVRDKPALPTPDEDLWEKGRLVKAIVRILKNPQCWWISLYSGLAYAPFSVFSGLWGVPFLQEAHMVTKTEAARVVSLLFIGFAIGAPFFGWLSDRIKKRNSIMLLSSIISLITICLIIYAPTGYITTCLFSFIFGFFVSGFLLCFTVIKESNTLLVTATATGVMNAFDAFFGAISDPLVGFFLDLGWGGEMVDGVRVFTLKDYQLSLSLLPVYFVISIICLFFIRETHCRQISA